MKEMKEGREKRGGKEMNRKKDCMLKIEKKRNDKRVEE